MKIFTSEQMAEIDARTIKDFQIPGAVLMENAGKAAADFVKITAEAVKTREIAVVCGKGSNGGDGFVCARYLEKSGFRVKTILIGRKRDVKGDAKKALDACAQTAPPAEIASSSLAKLKSEISSAGLVVDAIMGTGAKGAPKPPISNAIELISESGKPVISIDIPSGLDGSTGIASGACIKSAATVTMGFYKTGLLLNRGPELAGRVVVADIGIPPPASAGTPHAALMLDGAGTAELLPPRPKDAHKGSMGRVLIVGGSPGYSGAAVLSAGAALRSGAGLVFVGAPRTVCPVIECMLAESITKPMQETEAATLGLGAEEAVSALAESSDVLAVGPGLGKHPETAALTKKLILTVPCPMVIDADALNNLEGDASVIGNRRAPSVLTPHPGELARLLGTSVDEVLADPVGTVRDFSKKQDAVVLLKLPRTLIASPDGSVFINPTGNPGMATAGSGDVLTGMLAAFMARGLGVLEAARLGVYLHGLAGDEAARSFTEEAMTAGDITGSLPAAFRKIARLSNRED